MMGAFILGTTPQSIALKRALKIGVSGMQATEGEPEWVTYDGEPTPQQRAAWRHEVKQFRVIIALPPLVGHASEVISLVHGLRTDLYWEGHFVAVMPSDSRAEKLQEVSFVGETVEGTCFGQVPGHVVLTVPLQISRLIAILQKPDDRVSPEYWHLDLLRSDRAAQLDQQIKKAVRGLSDHEAGIDTEHVCREILTFLDDIDWALVARRGEGHTLSNSVRSLLEEYMVERRLTTEACSVIINEAKRILAQSTFPFPSEE